MHSRHPALGAFSHFLFLFARQLFLWPSPFLTPPPFFDQVREFVPLGAIIGQCGTRPPAPSTCLRFFFYNRLRVGFFFYFCIPSRQ